MGSDSENDASQDSTSENSPQTDALSHASPSSTYKTRGKITANTGTGVLGHNTSQSGAAYGVEGVTESTDQGAAGVKAVDTGGSPNETYGLLASTDATVEDAAAVEGRATATGSADAIRGIAKGGGGNGVYGIADGNPWYGVYARNEASSGTLAHGLFAETNSLDAPAIRADSRNEVCIEAEGAVDAETGYRGAIGSSAHLSGSSFQVTNIAQRIPFDTLVADQRSEFDTDNHWFECAYDGAYVVEIGLESSTATSGEIWLNMQIDQGNAGSNPAQSQRLRWEFAPEDGGALAKTFTKTIYGLLAGNRIYFDIEDSAGSLYLTDGPSETFMTVRQVGGGGAHTSSPKTTSTTSTKKDGA